MPVATPQTLNHFALVRFAPAYWARTPAARRQIRNTWLDALGGAAEAVHLYQGFGVDPAADLVLWTAVRADTPEAPARFFQSLRAAYRSVRRFLDLTDALWGLTNPSQYTKTRSTQELDPFATRSLPYLIIYPFVKTTPWYLTPREERQTMMLEHIKVGKHYKDITQLLLYSTGLQDQEFVVVYETADLTRFSQLVTDLRATIGRAFTERDTPLHTGIRIANRQELDAWL
ncbi:MAG: chlorite dismutase family protein [Gemmatimonadales bacterium]